MPKLLVGHFSRRCVDMDNNQTGYRGIVRRHLDAVTKLRTGDLVAKHKFLALLPDWGEPTWVRAQFGNMLPRSCCVGSNLSVPARPTKPPYFFGVGFGTTSQPVVVPAIGHCSMQHHDVHQEVVHHAF